MSNKDMPAMPTKGQLNRAAISAVDYQIGNNEEFQFVGLTKREIFAMHAMQGSWLGLTDENKPAHYSYSAESCVRMADALLAALDSND